MAQTDYKKDVEDVVKGIDRFVTSTIGLTINNDAEQKDAASLLTMVKGKSKELKAKKKSILDPLSAAVKEIKSLFDDPEKRLAEAEASIKDAMLAFHEVKDAEAQKKIDQINGRLERGTMKVETGVAKLSGIDQAETNLQTENGGVQIRQGQEKLRVIDAAKLIAAYPEILQTERVLEALRMEAAAIYKKGVYVLPGTEVYREKVIAGMSV